MNDNTPPIVLVTGASRGIGQAIADEMAANGYRVIGTATSDRGAEAIEQRLAGAATPGAGRVLDVNDAEGCTALIKNIIDSKGRIDVLVNNAGITRDGLMMRMSDDDWQRVIDTNLGSVFRLSKLVIKPMVKQRAGRIVNIGSVVGSTGNAGQVNYTAAKAGLLGLTRSMALEFGARNITVNAVAPGFIESDMTAELNEDQRATMQQRIALGRFGQPADIAAAVRFLASAEAAYITGQVLHVNGGMYMG